MKTTVRAENLSKNYFLGRKRSTSFRESVSIQNLFSRNKGECFWALKDISFEVKEGEVLGIIGKNGAGKSTLLKILSRITEPTEGRAEIDGRVASLLEVGTGFHPELTGRENIFLNGAILGMKQIEIKNKFAAIVDFSGIEKFIDTPVKHYSSGMYVRLAFAVAAHLEPEVLIVDEVLAVGDAEFQKKCLGKMKDVSEHDGRTVLFVSHNMSAVRQICQSGLWLNDGTVRRHGTVENIIGEYISSYQEIHWNKSSSAKENSPRITFVELDEVRMRNGEFYLRIGFDSPFLLKPPIPGFVVYNETGSPVFGSNPRIHSTNYPPNELTAGVAIASVKNISLYSGYYFVAVWLGDSLQDYDHQHNAIGFQYISENNYFPRPSPNSIGSLDPMTSWSVDRFK